MIVSIIIYLSIIYGALLAALNVSLFFYGVATSIFSEEFSQIINIFVGTIGVILFIVPVIISPLMLIVRLVENSENHHRGTRYALSYLFFRTPQVILESAKMFGHSFFSTITLISPVLISLVVAWSLRNYPHANIPYANIIVSLCVAFCVYYSYRRSRQIIVHACSAIVGIVSGMQVVPAILLTEVLYRSKKRKLLSAVLISIFTIITAWFSLDMNLSDLYSYINGSIFLGEGFLGEGHFTAIGFGKLFTLAAVDLFCLYGLISELRQIISEIMLNKLEAMTYLAHFDDQQLYCGF